ncbi:MAG: hypothetical protein A2293_05005 [Elusimicrobia bacterium RIFOXYB2_FULL_49_7]|nr:MAG: hypothetical protein A2293_05005 [Elusimicrobia bacterium RIFOXYB2_FULL_49_7]
MRATHACNQNAICGTLIKRIGNIDIWKTPLSTSPDTGWIGIFNRSVSPVNIELIHADMGLQENKQYKLFDIWNKGELNQNNLISRIDADGVLFIKHEKKN